jgi:hypothetical protein
LLQAFKGSFSIIVKAAAKAAADASSKLHLGGDQAENIDVLAKAGGLLESLISLHDQFGQHFSHCPSALLPFKDALTGMDCIVSDVFTKGWDFYSAEILGNFQDSLVINDDMFQALQLHEDAFLPTFDADLKTCSISDDAIWESLATDFGVLRGEGRVMEPGLSNNGCWYCVTLFVDS